MSLQKKQLKNEKEALIQEKKDLLQERQTFKKQQGDKLDRLEEATLKLQIIAEENAELIRERDRMKKQLEEARKESQADKGRYEKMAAFQSEQIEKLIEGAKTVKQQTDAHIRSFREDNETAERAFQALSGENSELKRQIQEQEIRISEISQKLLISEEAVFECKAQLKQKERELMEGVRSNEQLKKGVENVQKIMEEQLELEKIKIQQELISEKARMEQQVMLEKIKMEQENNQITTRQRNLERQIELSEQVQQQNQAKHLEQLNESRNNLERILNEKERDWKRIQGDYENQLISATERANQAEKELKKYLAQKHKEDKQDKVESDLQVFQLRTELESLKNEISQERIREQKKSERIQQQMKQLISSNSKLETENTRLHLDMARQLDDILRKQSLFTNSAGNNQHTIQRQY